MIRQANDPGFGEKFFHETKRVINKDGSFNVVRVDGGINGRDLYQFLINLSWPKFLLLVFFTFIVINSLFALFYLFIGINHLQRAGSGSGFQSFLNAFFFSVQTFTTVGYGGILPEGILANIFAAFEAMTGLLGFALATGLLYGRFSKPSAKIIFSKNAIISPHKGKSSLQFRIANQRHNILMELEARIMAVFIDKNKDQFTRKYYDLSLEMPSVYFLPLSWTVVHPIDKE